MTLTQHKKSNYVIVASLKNETMGQLINRIPGSCLLISSLPGLVFRTHVESLGKPRDSTSVLKALPGKLDMKSTNLVFSIYSKTQNQPAQLHRLASMS